jgi:excisionase family DNA binding protein
MTDGCTFTIDSMIAETAQTFAAIARPRRRKRGYTPREIARILRVSPDRIRALIKSGELGAVNMAKTRCGKPKFVVLPRHVWAFLAGRQAADPRPVKRRTMAPRPGFVTYY